MIKTGFCVAYDWELLRHSLPRVYDSSDRICLAIDVNSLTWSGNHYKFDKRAFEALVNGIDTDNKIDIYYDNFSLQDLNARENCNRQRQMIASRQGTGGWHIQVDVDEYFLDFKGFTEYLRKREENPDGKAKPINICANILPVYKVLDHGYLIIDFGKKIPENVPIATNYPVYEYARRNGHFDHLSSYYIVHETWARNSEELRFKITNWGHSAEELSEPGSAEKYMSLWESIDEGNYSNFRNVHPARPEVWPSLKYVEAKDTEELIKVLDLVKSPPSRIKLALRNSRVLRKLISLVD